VQDIDMPKLRPPLVSIIVTNYNYAQYLEQCLRSIADQSYSNYECVIVDDASDDNSSEVAQAFISKATRPEQFTFVRHEENRGQMAAFFTGLENSSGPFVSFVDSDDILFSDFVESHVQAHLNLNCAGAITSSEEVVIDGTGALISGCVENQSLLFVQNAKELNDKDHLKVGVDRVQQCWRFDVDTILIQKTTDANYVPPATSLIETWIWSTTSAMMYRRSVLDIIDKSITAEFRLCADAYIARFCHLIGGTIFISSAHGAYRRHGKNGHNDNTFRGPYCQATRGSEINTHAVDVLRSQVYANLKEYSALIPPWHMLSVLATITSYRDVFTVKRLIRDNSSLSFSKYLIRKFLQSFSGFRVSARRMMNALWTGWNV